MTFVPSTIMRAKIVTGKPFLDTAGKALWKDTMVLLNGEEVDIIIRPRRRQRTKKQNKLLHALFNLTAIVTGQSPKAVKDGVKQEWLVKHTAELDKVECEAVISWLFAELAELGIDLDPELVDWEEDEMEKAV